MKARMDLWRKSCRLKAKSANAAGTTQRAWANQTVIQISASGALLRLKILSGKLRHSEREMPWENRCQAALPPSVGKGSAFPVVLFPFLEATPQNERIAFLET